jgi:hypothetical protein
MALLPSPGRYVPDGPLDEGHIVNNRDGYERRLALGKHLSPGGSFGAVAGGYATGSE